MTENNILLVKSGEDDTFESILSAEGFNVIRVEDSHHGFNNAIEETPDLIIMGKGEFDRDGFEILKKIKARRLPIRVIICFGLIDIERQETRLIQAGVCDYVTPRDSYKIVEVVKRALALDNVSVNDPIPIVEKLLGTIEKNNQAYRELYDRYQWHMENQQRLVCNCEELLVDRKYPDKRRHEKPKSTAFQRLGESYDGYYTGDYYVCKVCGTNWYYAGWEDGMGEWEPADDDVTLIRTNPHSVTCPSCQNNQEYELKDLMDGKAICTTCGHDLSSIGQKMNDDIDNWPLSVLRVELAVELEKRFDVDYDDEELEGLTTIRDVIDLTTSKVSGHYDYDQIKRQVYEATAQVGGTATHQIHPEMKLLNALCRTSPNDDTTKVNQENKGS